MAHVTTPRWLSPVSRRIVVIIIAAAAAMMLLTSIIVTSASAAGPERVRNVQEPACQDLQVGGDTFKELIPRGDADPNFDEVIPLSGRSDVDLPFTVRLTAPPNRSFATFALDQDAIDAGVIVLGAVLFNRTDQKDGNLYDYRLEGGATSGTLEPPPRDQGNEKEIVLCFGSKASLSITAALNDIDVPVVPIPVVTNPLTWIFTVENTGGLPLTAVAVKEGTTTTCLIGDLAVGAVKTCTPAAAETGVIDEEVVTRTFTATGLDPELAPVTAATTPSYLVGLECGEATTTGGPLLTDSPYSAFWAGESSKVDGTCAVPISISSESTDAGQLVRVEPAPGFTWYGVTGLVTIQWDEETATELAVPRTLQVFDDGSPSVVVPWCDEVVGIALVTDPLVTDPWFYVLEPTSAIYRQAVPNGDTCLVLQSTKPVGLPESGMVQTTEVFYIFNDPILGRPK